MRATAATVGWIRAWAHLVLLCVLVCGALPHPAFAQIPALAGSAAKGSEPDAVHRDPLDRGTPRRAVAAFIRAAHRNDMVAALRYVQAGGRSQARAEDLVHGLNGLMDRYFHQPLASISDAPEGSLDDGLPLDRERIGPLKIGRRDVYLELVRVNDPSSGPVWLISSETLARVPAMLDDEERSWVEAWLPDRLFAPAAFGFSFAEMLVWVASLALPLLLLPLLLRLLLVVACRVLPRRREALQLWHDALHWPIVLALLVGLQLVALPWFGPTVSFRFAYTQVVLVVLVIVLAWGLHRLITLALRRVSVRVEHHGRTGVRSVLMLGERLLNVLLVLLAVLTVLSLAGFEVKTLLAGLGIVGIAVALGAQKTIENILGGMMLLGDEAIAVGDVCRINNRLGTVEDITLRSVRFRTIEQTLLSIPAGVLAQADLENFASRGKILAQHRLRLAYGTPVEQLRAICAQLGALVDAHPRLEHPLSRVRLIEFAPLGIELELYAYVLTSDLPEFLAIREDLLLQAAALVESAGARFADPTATELLRTQTPAP
ncbi:mechanosensitive ion channel [Ramlibacter ginsenosidimutans]|uniref:Mechanosensitive ion channel n=1 Tax=Ramlibacter ginsenosidimutans TaxID=502333 RepID=A0A934TSJ2_9BURK|nr:mechanosensitive ion channel [Ramlibacter ginsenosidimutans]